MDIDFSLVLTLAVLISGALWAFDALLLKPGRQERLQAAQAQAANAGQVLPNEASARILREPWLFETAHSFFPVLAVVWVLRSFIAEPFTIPSGSMIPTLEVGDYVLVNKFAYGIRLPVLGTKIIPLGEPQRGDVMVFRFPAQPSINYIKRVIGLPGDLVESRNEVLYINGAEAARELQPARAEAAPEEAIYLEQLGDRRHFTREEAGMQPAGSEWRYTVPDGSYFMMGDNRDNSNDSRFWGPVSEQLIVGRAFYIWLHKQPGLHWPTFSHNGSIQ
ncbi:signal peptidase I [Paraperlucidibaca baekdonensis]|uniref:Signal peptidase I n=1 Tax=Paraperlucidibaca baekdonensis TaxID=748120 RepID=A0A3E0H4P7_9GAMM|nr:signal peptidase I [Paraperlucidibaca baekdonensis]REH37873.1 signal peptidase I [Paraperlucidibaca baekdonensis]